MENLFVYASTFSYFSNFDIIFRAKIPPEILTVLYLVVQHSLEYLQLAHAFFIVIFSLYIVILLFFHPI